jgi:hypothetical protein
MAVPMVHESCERVRSGPGRAAPVSHQKRSDQDATDATKIERKQSKINEPIRHSPAHNGLVAGRVLPGPPIDQSLSWFSFHSPSATAPEMPRFVAHSRCSAVRKLTSPASNWLRFLHLIVDSAVVSQKKSKQQFAFTRSERPIGGREPASGTRRPGCTSKTLRDKEDGVSVRMVDCRQTCLQRRPSFATSSHVRNETPSSLRSQVSNPSSAATRLARALP